MLTLALQAAGLHPYLHDRRHCTLVILNRLLHSNYINIYRQLRCSSLYENVRYYFHSSLGLYHKYVEFYQMCKLVYEGHQLCCVVFCCFAE